MHQYYLLKSWQLQFLSPLPHDSPLMIVLNIGTSLWIALFSCLTAGDTSSFGARFVRVLDRVSSCPETARFLGLDDRLATRADLCVSDSIYSIDRFPFGLDLDSSEVSIFRADMLGPVRAIFVPDLASLPSTDRPRGMVFLSIPRQDTILAEVFPYRQEFRSYEEYCMSTDSMKFLLWAGPEGPAAILHFVHLLR